MVDIDWFKRVNDTYGHDVGDQVLRAVAKAIAETVRDGDVPARFGGEEFAVLLRHATRQVAIEVAERVRLAVDQLDLREWRVPGVSVSVGVAVGDRHDEPIGEPARPGRPGPVSGQARRTQPGRRGLSPATIGACPMPRPTDPCSRTPPWPRSSTRSATCSRSRASSSSRPSPTTGRPMRSATTRSSSSRAYREGNPPKIAGVGQAISDKIAELARTGHLAFYDRLAAEVPAGLVGLLRVPGVGPKTVRILSESLGIADLDGLRAAAQGGRLRTVKGLSEKAEASILAGIASLDTRPDRLLLGEAEEIIERLVAELGDRARRDPPRAGRLVPPPPRDDRRPRPAGRDHRRRRRSSSGSRRWPASSVSSAPVVTRRRSSSPAARRST